MSQIELTYDQALDFRLADLKAGMQILIVHGPREFLTQYAASLLADLGRQRIGWGDAARRQRWRQIAIIGTWTLVTDHDFLLDSVLENVEHFLTQAHPSSGFGSLASRGEAGIQALLHGKLVEIDTLSHNQDLPFREEALQDAWIGVVGYAIAALMLADGTLLLPMVQEKGQA